MTLGGALVVAGLILGSAAAGWKWKFSLRPIDWVIVGAGAVMCYAATALVKLEGKRQRQRQHAYLEELKNIADDLRMVEPDDQLDDLFLLYDEEEQKDILRRLAQMPKGERRLRVAMEAIDKENY